MTTERQAELRKATSHLSKNDPQLAPIIRHFGICAIQPHNNYYRELVDAIISQQLSVKASATIVRRFVALFDGEFPSPEQLLSRNVEELRSVGISRSKAGYVLDLATHIIDGSLQPQKLPYLTNEEVVTILTAVKGIGEWTAHMFLIFCLGRLDILPTGDQGVRTAMKRLYNLPVIPKPEEMRTIAATFNWHPYESIACWYLWKSLDNEPLPKS